MHILLTVDTNQYAGNFERESIAYATGQYGDCGVGREEAEIAHVTLPDDILSWWKAHTIHLEDIEHGCARPAFIHQTPGFFNNGYGGHFPVTEAGRTEALAHYKAQHLARRMKALNAIQQFDETTDEGRKKHDILLIKTEIAALADKTTIKEYPSYQTVGILLDSNPPVEVLLSFEQRMIEFLAEKEVEVNRIHLQADTLPDMRELRFRNAPSTTHRKAIP